MELNKTIQALKMEVETIKKTQRETTLEIEILGKKSGNISNRIQEIQERISGAEDSIENMGTTIKENAKCKKSHNSKHPGNPGHNEINKRKDNRYR
jgi:predicted  nucleic acid-binding Zn-ribbon protein